MKPGDLVQTIVLYNLYPTENFSGKYNGVVPEITSGTVGIVLALHLNVVRILTPYGIGWVGEHILRSL